MKRITNFFAVILLATMAMLVAGCGKGEIEVEYIVNNNTEPEDNADNNTEPEDNADNNIEPEDKATYNPDDWVDLELPSGLLWATRNVGASSPTDYGDFFAWGETRPKSDYWWSTYRYGSGDKELTKYCSNSEYGHNGFTDKLTTLLSDDDAAAVNVRGSRMPTRDDWEELLNNATSQWTSVNGVNGRIFTGHNGKTFFLPAAGERWFSNTSYTSYTSGVGSYGRYWSSSLVKGYPYGAWGIGFDSDGMPWNNRIYRFRGFSVRPVRSIH